MPNANGQPIGGAGGGGALKSVGLTLPAIFNVANSPLVASGTIVATLVNETANLVFAGPSSGAAAVPSFRALVAADIPALAYLTANQTITLSGDATGSGATAITATLATVNSNVGAFALATVTVNAKGLVTAASAAATTGSGNVVLATSPVITTPTIADFTNATHSHQNAAGGGSLDAAAIGSGVLANARVNFAAPSALGNTTPATVKATSVATPILGPTADSTAALIITKADLATAIVTVDTTNGFVGVGGTPATELTVFTSSASDPRGIMSAQYSTDTLGARLHFRKARGTQASPTVVVTGDLLGRLRFSGYDGASFLQMASIDAVTTGTIASTRVPTYLSFSVGTDAAPSVLTEVGRFTITGLNNAVIGATTPAAMTGTTITANTALSLSASGGFVRITDTNTSPTGVAGFLAVNDSNNYLFSHIYGSNHILTQFRNNAAFGAQNSFYILTDASSAIGGSGTLNFLTGGYDPTTQTRMIIDATGLMTVQPSNTSTNSVSNVLTLIHALTTINGGVNNIGTGLLFKAADSTSAIGAGTNIGRIRAWETVATHASLTTQGAISGYYVTAGVVTEVDAFYWGVNGSGAALLGLYAVTPVARPTTAIAAATFVANTSGIANDTATWDGYTMGQVVKALRNIGALT